MRRDCNLDLLHAEAMQLRDWMFESAFPLWATAGMHDSGAAWESLDFSGNPVPSDAVRVRVQARQLFVFALASRLGWQPDLCRDLMTSLFDVLVNGCRRDDGLFGKLYSLSNGALIDDRFSLYDTAFAILGFAVCRDCLDHDRVDAAIDAVISALETRVAHQSGGFFEELPAPIDRSQNPHMHLFESFLALRDTGYDDAIAGRVQTLYNFIASQFFDRRLDIVHERRPGDLSREVVFEPGHSFEWVWLLTWHAEDKNTDIDPIVGGLYQRALASLSRSGFACMEASIDGGQPDASCRLWSQAEALKAHVSMALNATPAERQFYVDNAVALCRGIRRDWLQPAHAGGWYDHLDEYGRLIASDIPTSTGYHLFGAIDTAIKSLQAMQSESNQ